MLYMAHSEQGSTAWTIHSRHEIGMWFELNFHHAPVVVVVAIVGEGDRE